MTDLEYASRALLSISDMFRRYAEQDRDEYGRGFAAGVASVGQGSRKVTGPQFMARMLNCVSPDSAAWAELHRLAESGFGRNMYIEDDS